MPGKQEQEERVELVRTDHSFRENWLERKGGSYWKGILA